MTASTEPTLWRAMAGFMVCAICFTLLYTVHAVACRYGILIASGAHAWTVLDTVLVAIWFACAAAMVRLMWSVRTSASSTFLRRLTEIIDVCGLGAIVVTGMPILAIPVCV